MLGLLNRFVAAAVSGNLIVSAVEALEEYMEDRPGFIRSVMLSLRLLHPEFISGLEASGLSETEIGYCCLYCIGMNGSEISSYLGRKSFFNDICVIRKKLGLGRHDMNIDRYLREKMRATE